MKLRFNDGVTIDTSGELRRLRLPDGLYVVGEGFSIPCRDEAEVTETLNEMRARRAERTSR